ncbi:condensation domain-containing protein, partial [Janthinobacterium sp. GMG1]|uniref:condensation domain-containing protein n=1 Tax=Janthinobacterium sp. GMG1 TaxID=3096007 RepID=UPI002ACA8587
KLASLPEVHSLPLDHPRPAQQSFEGALLHSRLDAQVSSRLHAVCREHGATLFMGLHAALSALLSRYSGASDIVLGTPVANREQPEIAGLIGFFVNTLVLRAELTEDMSFGALLQQCRQTNL